MNTKTEQSITILDRILLFVAAALVVAGVVGFYYFAEQQPQLFRVAGLLAALILATIVAMQSEPGRRLWHFSQSSRIELRKVIWPTRQEALQTTLAVIVFVIIMGVFFWLLDMVLLYVTQYLTGRGA